MAKCYTYKWANVSGYPDKHLCNYTENFQQFSCCSTSAGISISLPLGRDNFTYNQSTHFKGFPWIKQMHSLQQRYLQFRTMLLLSVHVQHHLWRNGPLPVSEIQHKLFRPKRSGPRISIPHLRYDQYTFISDICESQIHVQRSTEWMW